MFVGIFILVFDVVVYFCFYKEIIGSKEGHTTHGH